METHELFLVPAGVWIGVILCKPCSGNQNCSKLSVIIRPLLLLYIFSHIKMLLFFRKFIHFNIYTNFIYSSSSFIWECKMYPTFLNFIFPTYTVKSYVHTGALKLWIALDWYLGSHHLFCCCCYSYGVSLCFPATLGGPILSMWIIRQ